MSIHETAIIKKGASIDENVTIGPYSIIGENVKISSGTFVDSHVCIDGDTLIGKNNKIYPFSSIGKEPQDLKYKGEPTKLIIGDNNKIRECVTVNLGTFQGGGVTSIGDNNLLMAYSHVAHDCILGNNIVIANNVSLAGHVTIEDYVVLGGFSGVTQFNKVGKHAFVAAYSLVKSDFPPFFVGKGLDDFKIQSVNSIGLSRRGFSEQSIRNLKEAFKKIYIKKITLEKALEELKELEKSDEVNYLVQFIKSSKNGIVR